MKRRKISLARTVFLGVLLLSPSLLVGCQTQPNSAPLESASEAPSGDLYFPPLPGEGDWATIRPADAGFDEATLEQALAYAGEQRSSGVVVLYAGKILAEKYWQVPDSDGSRYPNLVAATTDDGRAIEDVASVQKSVVSFLAGVAEGKGLLDFDWPVSQLLGSGWSKATAEEEAKIRIHHLMSMTSGLRPNGTFEAEPGSTWRYNTNMYSRLVAILEQVSGSTIDELTSQWLTEPTGMVESRWVPRPWAGGGQDANRIGFGTSARDLARFGLLVERNGQWCGQNVLDNPGFLAKALRPSQALNPSYGSLWWVNGQERRVLADGTAIDGPLVPGAPADLYAGLGALGRKVYVVPSQKLVVTRLGDAPERSFDREFWRLLMEAVPDQ